MSVVPFPGEPADEPADELAGSLAPSIALAMLIVLVRGAVKLGHVGLVFGLFLLAAVGLVSLLGR